MRLHINKIIQFIVLYTVSIAAQAQVQAAPDKVPVASDLTAVIALQGLPCGQVVTVKEQGENDYLATCADGNRYRVYVNGEGRVIAAKQ